MKTRIIADDFTSATDGVVAFAQMGCSTGVVFTHFDGRETDAMSVDTDSRLLGTDEASARVATWARRWRSADLLVKQFDSTLRGPLAHECLAAWRASARPRMLVAPAFPAAGRCTVAGVVTVDGIPVSETAFARDPLNPVTTSDVCHLFEQAGVVLFLAAGVTQALAFFAAGARAVLVDAHSDDDLLTIARTFSPDRSLLWAGSTGIVRALAMSMATSPARRTESASSNRCERPWVLLGSRNPKSRDQAAHLLNEQPDVFVLRTADGDEDPRRAASAIALRLADAIRHGACDGFVATGGETAKAAFVALGATGLSVVKEVEPGIALTLLHLGNLDIPLVTKAGGFGDEQTLVRCVNSLLRM